MAVTAKTTATKKTNTTTEVIVGQSAQHLTKAVAELNQAVSLVGGLESKSAELSLQVANKTAEIEGLDAEYTEKLRQKDVEFGLQFKENSTKVVTEFLSANGDVAISRHDLAALKNELETVKSNSQKEADKAVAIVSSKLKSEHESAMKLAEAEHKSSSIESNSKNSSLAEKNTFLEAQVAKLYEQLDSERNASIERAKAGAVGAINVNGAGK